MNLSADPVAEVPPGVVTVMSTVPAEADGEVATQLVTVEQVTAVADPVPNLTDMVDDPVMNPVPVMVTTVPPASGPATGVMEETVGSGS